MVKSKIQCKLIVDSCCDLPRNILDSAGVELFQFPFNMNDGEHLDDMWTSMKAKEFYDRLRKGEVSGTAQVPALSVFEAFERAAVEGVPTVCIVFSSGLSGTFETISHIADDVRKKHPTFELYVIDSKLGSIAEGVLVHGAIRQRARGLTADRLAEWAKEARWYVNCLFTVDDLEHLRRGGRIPDMAAMAGQKLDVKPLMNFNIDGTLHLMGIARGHKKALRALVECYQKRHADGEGADAFVLIGSADNEGAASWVDAHLNRPESALPAIRCNIGPVIGSHVGPGMVAVSFWGVDRRARISIADRIANKLGSKSEE